MTALQLPALWPDASLRTVLCGGGRGVVLGAEVSQSWVEQVIDGRWTVSGVRLPAGSLVPATGDIVLWRGVSAAAPDEWFLWGGPCRVLGVRRDAGGTLVHCLEDQRLDAAALPPAHVDTIVESIEHDRFLGDDELWSLLSAWGLRPFCARCGEQLWPIAYGLLPGPPDDALVGGCVLWPDAARWQCRYCEHALVSVG